MLITKAAEGKLGLGWICCQLGAREHYAVARALHRRHALRLMVTDAWVRPENPLGKLNAGLGSRFHSELSSARVYASNLSNIAFELRTRCSGLRDWQLIIARNRWFQQIAVENLSLVEPNINERWAVMAYSYAALEIFKLARSRGWLTVLGQIDPGPPEDRIVAKLYEDSPDQVNRLRRPPPEYWSSWREECALADRIVVNSEWSRQALLTERVPAEKIKVVPLAYEPTDAGLFHREYPTKFTSSRPLRVLFLGQINLRKGVSPLLDAIRLLREEPVEFVFVGPIQITVPPDMRIDPRIRWVGTVSHDRAAEFYRDADLFVFPTFSDGFGLTQLEAQAWRLPIISTKFCGEVVEDGRNGWLLPEITPHAIEQFIRRCLADPVYLKERSANAMSPDLFDIDSLGKKWLGAFE